MNLHRLFLLSLGAGLGVAAMLRAGSGLLCAEEEAVPGVKKYGVVHNIAEDRRVEKVGGLYEPEGLDIYIKRHLDAFGAKIEALESKLDDFEKKLDETSGLIRKMAENSKEKGPDKKQR